MKKEYVIELTPTGNGKSLVCGECNAEISAETKKELENAVIEHMNSIHQLKRGQLRIPD